MLQPYSEKTYDFIGLIPLNVDSRPAFSRTETRRIGVAADPLEPLAHFAGDFIG